MIKKCVLYIIATLLLLSSCTSTSSNSVQESSLENNKNEIAKLKFKEIEANVKNAYIHDGIFRIQVADDMMMLMNMDGELISDLKYKLYMGFSEEYAFVEDENNNKYYINTLGEKVIDKVDDKDIFIGDAFKNGMAKIFFEPINIVSNEKIDYIYIDKEGNIIDYKKPMYKNYEIFYANEFGAFYTDSACVGIFDNKRNEAISDLDYIEISGSFIKDRVIAINKNNEVLLIDSKANIIENFSEKYKEKLISSYDISNDGIVINFENANSIILDLNAESEIVTNYTHIGKFIDGFANAIKDGKYGLIDINGNEIIPFEYDEMSVAYKKSVLLKKFNKWYICNFFSE